MAFLHWISGCVLTVIIIAFAVMNRDLVAVVWSPLHPSYEMPLYGVILAALGVGFLTGVTSMWLTTLPVYLEKRRQRKEIARLENQLKTAKKPAITTPASDFFPALPERSASYTLRSQTSETQAKEPA